MLEDFFVALIEWIHHNPHWAYLVVFLVAAGESLFIVGLILPGIALMFGVGTLVAAGALALGPTLLWAAAGAVVGDSASFWIGRHFRQRLRVIWPFSHYAALLDSGADFLRRHGGKSVLLARFVGPMRPVLPAVAGMLHMAPRRFLAVNIFSAVLWAPVAILPGAVFGASLALAAEVAGRLATLLAIALGVLWFGVWLVRTVVRFLQRRAAGLMWRAFEQGRQHPLLQPLIAAVLDPAHPEARGLAVLLGFVAIAGVALAWLFSGWLVGLDTYVRESLQQLHNPVADRIMVLVTGVGDGALVMTVLGTGCAWLFLRGRPHAALHWLAAGASAALMTWLLTLAVVAPRLPDERFAALDFGFLGAHGSLDVAVYGFLSVLIARELSLPRRWIAYVVAALVLISVAFSRLYLGEHGLSDVLIGVSIGLACVALVGIAYRRHPARTLNWPALALIVCATVVGMGVWRAQERLEPDLMRYARALVAEPLDAGQWWASEWLRVPALRQDLRARSRQALRLQYAGELGELRDALYAQGWRDPTSLTARSALAWLSPGPAVDELPVLPQVHSGQHDALSLIRQAPDDTLHIVRLWPTRWQLVPGDARLWVGSVARLELRQRMGWFSYAVTGPSDTGILAPIRRQLEAACTVEPRRWDGASDELLLIRDCKPDQRI